MKLGFLSHWGTQAVLSLALGYARCVPCLSHAVGRARGGVGRSSSKRWGTTAAGGVYSKKSKRKHRGASGVAACAGVRTSGASIAGFFWFYPCAYEFLWKLIPECCSLFYVLWIRVQFFLFSLLFVFYVLWIEVSFLVLSSICALNKCACMNCFGNLYFPEWILKMERMNINESGNENMFAWCPEMATCWNEKATCGNENMFGWCKYVWLVLATFGIRSVIALYL